jgi:recombinational DNA repair protein RecT
VIDERPIRQIVIDRIIAYNNSLDFYTDLQEIEYDFDVMTDNELIHVFEMLVFNNHKVKTEWRKVRDDAR